MKHLTDQNLSNEHFFNTFNQLKYGDLHIREDESSGMLAIIAIHSTFNDHSLGGCRFVEYGNINEAIIDALKLAHAMSYKAAICDLPLGGGKAVVMKHQGIRDRTQLFNVFGQFVHSLGGRYITAEDSGTSIADMDIVRTQTSFVTGNSAQTFTCKDPSILTALGVRKGIEAAIQYQLKKNDLSGIHVAIQGLGNVGFSLAKDLYEHGAKLTVCDINDKALSKAKDELKATIVPPGEIHKVACDVYAPCALGNAINHNNIHDIQARIIAGSANNQLENEEIALKLKSKGVLYAPDYVINSGGLIHVTAQYFMQDELTAKEKVINIYQTLLDVFERADKENLTTIKVANNIAEKKLAARK